MIERKKILAITLAKGTSESIPKKNLVVLNGKPLIDYTFDIVKPLLQLDNEHNLTIDRYIVSTEDKEIAAYCKYKNVEVLERPDILSKPNTTSAEAIKYVLQHQLDEMYDYIVECMITNPFKTVTDLAVCIHKLHKNPEYNSVVTVSELSDHHPSRIKYIQDGFLTPFYPEPKEAPRQLLSPKAYIRNGGIYAFRLSSFLAYGNRVGYNCSPVIMSRPCVNIDSLEDLYLAEILMKNAETKPTLSYPSIPPA